MQRVPWRLLAPILILAAVVIAYGNSLHGPFIFDDLRAIPKNASIRSFRTAFAAPPGNTFAARPAVNLSFAANYALFGFDVRGYHLTNIAIHAAAVDVSASSPDSPYTPDTDASCAIGNVVTWLYPRSAHGKPSHTY